MKSLNILRGPLSMWKFHDEKKAMNTEGQVIQLKPGQRVRLLHMADKYHPVPDSTEGTVDFIDDGGNIHMKWDNGRTLALIPDVDEFILI